LGSQGPHLYPWPTCNYIKSYAGAHSGAHTSSNAHADACAHSCAHHTGAYAQSYAVAHSGTHASSCAHAEPRARASVRGQLRHEEDGCLVRGEHLVDPRGWLDRKRLQRRPLQSGRHHAPGGLLLEAGRPVSAQMQGQLRRWLAWGLHRDWSHPLLRRQRELESAGSYLDPGPICTYTKSYAVAHSGAHTSSYAHADACTHPRSTHAHASVRSQFRHEEDGWLVR